MLRHAVFFLLFLIFAVWLGHLLQQDPGFALFVWRHTSVEMPLWFAALCLLALLYLCWLLSGLLGALPHLFTRLRYWRTTHKLEQACQRVSQGLLELYGHQWKKAKRHFAKPAGEDSLEILRTLGAAYAAHQLGDTGHCESALASLTSLPAARLLEADVALGSGQPEKAFALLSGAARDPASLIRLQKAYRRSENWQALWKIIPDLRKSGVLSPEKAERLERKTVCALLGAAGGNANTLQSLWEQLPRHLQRDVRVVRAFALPMSQHPDSREKVGALLTSTLSRQFDSTLVRLYGELILSDPRKQLQRAEKWLKQFPKQPALLLTLGRLAIRCRLWGKARDYLNDCLTLRKNDRGAHAALGLLEEQTGDLHAALAQYRAGLKELIP